ncbi:putative bifunctional diguanylate cyclase/phosphodiesterase [Marinobacter lacisalsi]|uniref:Bifunctional diguanylate cyclase/phosphodiesterase n=1 Tax=Marinobacter lacisalsi TaxID=475979 RepID=A0ABV8QJZ8_9GAMM
MAWMLRRCVNSLVCRQGRSLAYGKTPDAHQGSILHGAVPQEAGQAIGVAEVFVVSLPEVRTSPVRIALIYLALGCLWILFSDQLVAWLFAGTGTDMLSKAQTFKGWVFVLVSAVLIGWLVHQSLQKLEHATSFMTLQSSMIEHAHTGILAADAGRRIIYANPAIARMNNVRLDRVLGRPLSEFRSGAHDDAFYDQLWQEVESSGLWQGEVVAWRRDGSMYNQWVTVTRVNDSKQKAAYYILFITDITEEKADKERLRYLAFYDPLTDLPNRAMMSDHIRNALRQTSEQGDCQVALMFIDLDDFKTINESYGHQLGDRLLQVAGQRILQTLSDGHELGRFGGDEFVVMMPRVTDQQQVEQLATALLDALGAGFRLDDNTRVMVRASIGICLACGDRAGDNLGAVSRLFSQADSALSEAKLAGKNTFAFYNADMTRLARRRLELEEALTTGLALNQFELFYQPVYSIGTGELTGAEALIRWRHPEWGLVSPGEFIPLTEETGLIVELGEWVLREAAGQVRQWLDQGLEPGSVAINVSSRQLMRGHFPGILKQAVENAGIPAHRLEMELTESSLLALGDRTTELLAEMRATGARLAVDDFGTGYSSLSYLRRFKVDKLKIDSSFVNELAMEGGGEGIVKAIIRMGQAMDLEVQAEGVELESQLVTLAELGCDSFQGFLRAAPMPAGEFQNLLTSIRSG